MGHEFGALPYHIATGRTVKKAISGANFLAMPTMRNGQKPKYCLVEAIRTNAAEVIYAVPGDWITFRLNTVGNGNLNFDHPLVVGNDPLLIYVHGYSNFGLDFPTLQDAANRPASITFQATALENF